ncbi:MAG: hypothetical protein K0B11_07630 [Mariniphaga sp.]|nr:hypothetical protein [Mariniphaga sp.]
MKVLIFIINISFFCGWQIAAQTYKDIYLDNSEKIDKLTASGKYIGLSLYNTVSHKKKGILYDTLGNKLFEYEPDTAFLKNFFPNEKNNQVIVIAEQKRNNHAYMDEIISYDINNKTVNWKTKALGQCYKMSPNGKYLLTARHHEDPDLKSKSGLNIVDLESGNLLPLNNNYTGFIADWFDSTRIIIYTWVFELKKNEQFINKYQKYTEGLDSLSKIKAKLYSDFNKGYIGKDEYNVTLHQLNNDQKDFIIAQRKQLSEQGMPYTSKVREYKLIKYNILTNQIEMEKNIMKGENIATLVKEISIGNYLGENDITVYLKETKNRLHKLDSNLNLVWTTELEFPFYTVIKNDRIYFVIYEPKNDVYKLITNDGKKQFLSKADDIVVNIQKNKLEYSNIIDLRGNFSFNKENNIIKLSKD